MTTFKRLLEAFTPEQMTFNDAINAMSRGIVNGKTHFKNGETGAALSSYVSAVRVEKLYKNSGENISNEDKKEMAENLQTIFNELETGGIKTIFPLKLDYTKFTKEEKMLVVDAIKCLPPQQQVTHLSKCLNPNEELGKIMYAQSGVHKPDFTRGTLQEICDYLQSEELNKSGVDGNAAYKQALEGRKNGWPKPAEITPEEQKYFQDIINSKDSAVKDIDIVALANKFAKSSLGKSGHEGESLDQLKQAHIRFILNHPDKFHLNENHKKQIFAAVKELNDSDQRLYLEQCISKGTALGNILWKPRGGSCDLDTRGSTLKSMSEYIKGKTEWDGAKMISNARAVAAGQIKAPEPPKLAISLEREVNLRTKRTLEDRKATVSDSPHPFRKQ